jgi:hypothetical protein
MKIPKDMYPQIIKIKKVKINEMEELLEVIDQIKQSCDRMEEYLEHHITVEEDSLVALENE